MKPKKTSKKLQLNKNTIANIEQTEMSEVKGGYKPTVGVNSCPTICYTLDSNTCKFGWVCDNPSEVG